MVTLRATCIIHAALGCGVTPATWTFPAAQMDEKQDVIRHQPTQCPDLGREEVGGDQDVHVRADELLSTSWSSCALGAGGMPWRLRILPTVWSLIV